MPDSFKMTNYMGDAGGYGRSDYAGLSESIENWDKPAAQKELTA
jgi:hypothetical protein